MKIKRYEAVVNGLAKVGLWFIIAGYAVMTLVTFIEVIRRYAMGLSFPWAEELVRFLLVTTTFIGGAVAYQKGSLVLFDVLLKKLTRKKSALLNIFNHLVVFIVSLTVVKLGLDYALAPAVLNQKSPGLGIPMVVPYGFIPLAFTMMCLFAIGHILRGWSEMRSEGGELQ